MENNSRKLALGHLSTSEAEALLQKARWSTAAVTYGAEFSIEDQTSSNNGLCIVVSGPESACYRGCGYLSGLVDAGFLTSLKRGTSRWAI